MTEIIQPLSNDPNTMPIQSPSPTTITTSIVDRSQSKSRHHNHLNKRDPDEGRGSGKERASLIFTAVACAALLVGLFIWYVMHRKKTREKESRERYTRIAFANEGSGHRHDRNHVYGQGAFPGRSYNVKRW